MTGPDPGEFGWWLASRAAGVVALLCIAVSVGVGLAMAGRLRPVARAHAARPCTSRPRSSGSSRSPSTASRCSATAFLKPSIGDIVVPFTSAHEPLWTGLGVTGGWLAAILGLSYWIRNRIGAGAVAQAAPRDGARLRPRGRAHARRRHRRVRAVDARAARRDRRADPLPLRHAGPHAAPGPGVPPLPRRRDAPGERDGHVVRARPGGPQARRAATSPASSSPLRADLPGGRQLRSYSLSCGPRAGGYRISVKREPGGAVSEHLHTAVAVGDTLELGAPNGRFVLGAPSARPLVLISAGHRRDAGARDARRARRAAQPSARCGGSTARATATSTRSAARRRRTSRACRAAAATCATAARTSATSSAATTTRPAA